MRFDFSQDYIKSLEEGGNMKREINPLDCDDEDFKALICYHVLKYVNESDALRTEVSQLREENKTLQTSVNDVVEENLSLRQKVEALEEKERDRQRALTDLTGRVKKLEKSKESAILDVRADRDRILNLERHSRSRNLRFAIKAVKESDREDTTKILNENLAKHGINVKIENSHRVGPRDPTGVKERQIIAAFLERPDRYKVISKRGVLFKAGIAVYDDLCAHDFAIKKKYSAQMKTFFQEGKRVKFQRGSWYVDGQLFVGDTNVDPDLYT